MPRASLRTEHERYARVETLRLGGVPVAVEWLPYGAEISGEPQEIVATYGLLELEYAAFRRGTAVMDRTDRATLAVTGKDRVEFLNRMVTQELKGMTAGQARSAFWLNRKGRIDADLLLCELPDQLLVDLDVHDATSAVKSLGAFIFAEDVQIVDVSDQWVRVSLHGPGALELLAAVGAPTDAVRTLNEHGSCVGFDLDGTRAVAARRDQCAAPGIEMWVGSTAATLLFENFIRVQEGTPHGRRAARPAGWYAYNIARIEAGTPLFHVDFGPENLPHETGVLHERVSFKKGCYLGQEVVARMESLGKPKQRLVALRVTDDLLPTAGSPVFERSADGQPGNPVGAVTSSALSPMLGAAPIAFAMVKSAHAVADTVLVAPAEGGRTEVRVRPQLPFLSAEGKPL